MISPKIELEIILWTNSNYQLQFKQGTTLEHQINSGTDQSVMHPENNVHVSAFH